MATRRRLAGAGTSCLVAPNARSRLRLRARRQGFARQVAGNTSIQASLEGGRPGCGVGCIDADGMRTSGAALTGSLSRKRTAATHIQRTNTKHHVLSKQRRHTALTDRECSSESAPHALHGSHVGRRERIVGPLHAFDLALQCGSLVHSLIVGLQLIALLGQTLHNVIENLFITVDKVTLVSLW